MVARAKAGTPSTSVAPVAAPAVSPVSTAIPVVHDLYRQASLLRQALQSDKVRIGYFLGAGCPLGIYDDKGEKSLSHVPDVAGLTALIRTELEERDKAVPAEQSLAPVWDTLTNCCKDGTITTPHVEHLLSEMRTICGRRGNSDVDGLSKEQLSRLDVTTCDIIAEVVGKPLPSHRCAYHRFAAWVGGLRRTAPVELFTPNYDLLLEEAFEQQSIPHFDGFVGAREPFFDIASIEQDAIPLRWTRLWKLHGSVNWERRDDGGVLRVARRAANGKAMIYPSHLKYDQSRRMPYLAMLDRLKSFFRTGGHAQGFGPPVMVVCGYSFSDDHLNEILLDGLRGNRSAQCFVLVYGDLASLGGLRTIAERQPNLSAIAWDGAIIGTRIGLYRADGVSNADPWILLEDVPAPTGSGDPVQHARCRLGDFHYLGLFLEQLCGGLVNEPAS